MELDDVVDLAELEFAALDFARRALGELIAAAVDTRTAERFYAVSGWLTTSRLRRPRPARDASLAEGSAVLVFRTSK